MPEWMSNARKSTRCEFLLLVKSIVSNPPLIGPPQAFTADPLFCYIVFDMNANALMNATGFDADKF